MRPNPYVDNARPGPGINWADFGGRFYPVETVKLSAGHSTPRGIKFLFLARLIGADGPVAYALGPSQAVAKLDEILSQGS